MYNAYFTPTGQFHKSSLITMGELVKPMAVYCVLSIYGLTASHFPSSVSCVGSRHTATTATRVMTAKANRAFACTHGDKLHTNVCAGSLADSYYEYLLKCWILFGDDQYRRMYLQAVDGALT